MCISTRCFLIASDFFDGQDQGSSLEDGKQGPSIHLTPGSISGPATLLAGGPGCCCYCWSHTLNCCGGSVKYHPDWPQVLRALLFGGCPFPPDKAKLGLNRDDLRNPGQRLRETWEIWNIDDYVPHYRESNGEKTS